MGKIPRPAPGVAAAAKGGTADSRGSSVEKAFSVVRRGQDYRSVRVSLGGIAIPSKKPVSLLLPRRTERVVYVKRSIWLTVFLITGLLLSLPSLANAAPETGQFFWGIGVGDAAFNNDAYIYSSEAAARQPEMAPHQSSRQDEPAYSVYAGKVLLAKETDLLGNSVLNVGVQGGYADLGEFTTTVEYGASGWTGYRKVDESAIDLLLTSSLHWENGLNLFAKAGVARLQGQYEQAGLRSIRQPEYDPPKESYTYVSHRPEVCVGVGYLISDKVNISAQYTSILGPMPDSSDSRFTDSEMIELPNTLYKVDCLSIGATLYW